MSTGSSQGCVLTPLLFTLLTHDCAARLSENDIIKFADDATVVGLLRDNKKIQDGGGATSSVVQVPQPRPQCGQSRGWWLMLGGPTTYTDGAASERLSNVKVHLADDLTLTSDTTASEEHSSGSILSGGLPTAHITTVYIRHGTNSLTSWFKNCKAFEQKQLRRSSLLPSGNRSRRISSRSSRILNSCFPQTPKEL